MQPILGVPVAALATPAGQISVLYVHLVTMLIVIGWAIGQGSDVVSGEIARGTMEHLAALPIRRATLLAVPSAVSAAGALLLAFSVWLGSLLGLLTVHFHARVSSGQFLPAVLNLAALTFCLTGLTTLFSACGRDRWQTIKLSGGLYLVSLVLKMTARLWPAAEWLRWTSFLAAYEPQQLVLMPGDPWRLLLGYDAILVGLGLLALLAATAIFSYRDLPVAR
jgi:hypothetical protein